MVCTSRKPPSVCMIIYRGRQGKIWGLPLCNVSSFVIARGGATARLGPPKI